MTSYLSGYNTIKLPAQYTAICSILAASYGGLLSYIPTGFAIKLSTSILMVGLYTVALLLERTPLKKSMELQTTVYACSWVFIVFLLTQTLPLILFFIFVILGFFVLKELVDPYITKTFRRRLTVLELIFIFIFAFIITTTIIKL